MTTAATVDPTKAPTTNKALLTWVSDMAALTKPASIVWCDGSEEERARFTELAVKDGILEP